MTLEKPKNPIRVMIVDDSAVIRIVIERILKKSPHIEICGKASNGRDAVAIVETANPDVIILDLEMPVMDGITALPLLLEKKRGVKVIICSTLSAKGADISIKAMQMGAAECVLKPSGADAVSNNQEFESTLLRTVHLMSARPYTEDMSGDAAAPARLAGTASVPEPKEAMVAGVAVPDKITLRPLPLMPLKPKVLLIGSSTGGPNALMDFLKRINGLNVPIVITQHMPKTFTAILATHIGQATGRPTTEGQEGMSLQPGHIYIAPGGFHMLLRGTADHPVLHLDEGPMENFCRPAVDPMLRSAVQIFGGRIMTVILTGMGSDGLGGCREVVQAGGIIAAQDQATSVVWGMPGAVANAGLCSAVEPLDKLADFVLKIFR